MWDISPVQKTVNMEMTVNDKIDILEGEMQYYPPQVCPLKHTFTETQYIREIFMPKGSLITSQIHLTEHPFFVLEGVVSVFSENDGETIIQAPYSGITTPNTRRVLFVHEDCRWATVHHRLPNETVEEIGDRIIEKHDNPLLSDEMKKIYKSIGQYGLNHKNELL